MIAGLVTGLFSIPEGMAYASIGGFNPVAGLYSGVVSTIVGSMFARTVLMVTTLTSALALTSQSVLSAAGLDPTDPSNIAALVLVAGAVMLLFGLLRFGAMMNFVSNAVMTGFTTGIALQIIAGVIHDATGYRPDSHNTVGKFVDALIHFGSWQLAPCLVALGTVAVWAVFYFIKALEAFATLIALVVVTAVVSVIAVDVETVGDIASIPNALPPVQMPNFGAMPELLAGGWPSRLSDSHKPPVSRRPSRIRTAAGPVPTAISSPKGRRTWPAASSAPCRRAARCPEPEWPSPPVPKPDGRASSPEYGWPHWYWLPVPWQN
ncbi:hypothetical protein MGAD_52420 [Mycolicibacterium gadium]|uniref:SLC26A/SulP transporter domain-containing protein n=1 Tax=Mycolicibacterium gadium TaxID=1794 RepID=A0A7I7WVZ9_MYCGU|nr:hypothetical protein MGAD_52420 [Mycolicibacterium gadium]